MLFKISSKGKVYRRDFIQSGIRKIYWFVLKLYLVSKIQTKTWIFHTIVDPEWEVKKSDIRLLNVLGDGAFGRVYAGELIVNEKITKCAVKKLKSNACSEERENFLKEANIMKWVNSYSIK